MFNASDLIHRNLSYRHHTHSSNGGAACRWAKCSDSTWSPVRGKDIPLLPLEWLNADFPGIVQSVHTAIIQMRRAAASLLELQAAVSIQDESAVILGEGDLWVEPEDESAADPAQPEALVDQPAVEESQAQSKAIIEASSAKDSRAELPQPGQREGVALLEEQEEAEMQSQPSKRSSSSEDERMEELLRETEPLEYDTRVVQYDEEADWRGVEGGDWDQRGQSTGPRIRLRRRRRMDDPDEEWDSQEDADGSNLVRRRAAARRIRRRRRAGGVSMRQRLAQQSSQRDSEDSMLLDADYLEAPEDGDVSWEGGSSQDAGDWKDSGADDWEVETRPVRRSSRRGQVQVHRRRQGTASNEDVGMQ